MKTNLYKTSILHHNINKVTMKDRIKRNIIFYYENTITRRLEEEKGVIQIIRDTQRVGGSDNVSHVLFSLFKHCF